ncbi:MAG: bifunctional alpha/beta hydrolase/OsmC family protein [Gammaproteobacteria bacterium]|nr:bifunctional alpha/beta hydrolase/OsmC family protein [Gammaproteobacteria bacterium]
MTIRKKVNFENNLGITLSAALELPLMPIKYYAIFAHCFSCGKDIFAASRISRSLASAGIAVLRFDFTGIGESEGDFGNSNFSSNIDDILSAAKYLQEEYSAPQLLIGHSLGGTAVIHAAKEISECKAVVSIGSPSTPNHILKHFPSEVKQLEHLDSLEVEIGGKSFDIKKQFVDDLNAKSSTSDISKLRKAILIFHSPLDEIVSIEEATRIFVAVKHPKSFITLDKADHLLSDPDDSEYVANTIAAWAERYIQINSLNSHNADKGEVLIGEGNQKFLREVSSDDHHWLSDEPKAAGGDNLGPDPYEQLLSSLGTCTSMTLRMYCNHKGWTVDNIEVKLSHMRSHVEDCKEHNQNNCKVEVIKKEIVIEGELDTQQKDRLIEVADRCPVHKTLLSKLEISSDYIFK